MQIAQENADRKFDTSTGSLAELLQSYEAKVFSGESMEEKVAARVQRQSGFQNSVETGQGHSFLVDEPENFGGKGQAADPAEVLLAAIGASLSVTITAHAALRGTEIEKLGIELGATMDPETFFRPCDDAAAGIQRLQLIVRLRSTAEQPALEDLIATAMKASPVVQSLRHSPAVQLIVEKN